MKLLLKISMLFAVLSSLAGISGCGNKGALYIPEPPAEAQSTESTAK